MKIYELKYTEKFEQDKELLCKAGNISLLKKLANILRELVEHPTTGTGKPKQLSSDRAGQWSRKISNKHRLVYTILKIQKLLRKPRKTTKIILIILGEKPNISMREIAEELNLTNDGVI